MDQTDSGCSAVPTTLRARRTAALIRLGHSRRGTLRVGGAVIPLPHLRITRHTTFAPPPLPPVCTACRTPAAYGRRWCSPACRTLPAALRTRRHCAILDVTHAPAAAPPPLPAYLPVPPLPPPAPLFCAHAPPALRLPPATACRHCLPPPLAAATPADGFSWSVRIYSCCWRSRSLRTCCLPLAIHCLCL